MKCRRRMANSTGSVRELELWVDGRGEAFFESAPDSVKGSRLMNECVGDGVEEKLEDFEDAGGGDVLVVVGFCSCSGFCLLFAGVRFGTVGEGAGRRCDGGLFRQACGFRLGLGFEFEFEFEFGFRLGFGLGIELGFVGSGGAGILRVEGSTASRACFMG